MTICFKRTNTSAVNTENKNKQVQNMLKLIKTLEKADITTEFDLCMEQKWNHY